VRAAFDPVSNLRVGVQVLKECITRAGGLEAGLKFYVGAANLGDDGGYAVKVLAEQSHLKRVAEGKWVSVSVTSPSASATPPTQKTSGLPDFGSAEALPTPPDSKRVAWIAPQR
jgi:hypothetical protein